MTPVLRTPSNRKNYVWKMGQQAGGAGKPTCVVHPPNRVIPQSVSDAGTMHLMEASKSYCLAGQMQGFASFAGKGQFE